jgi:hypothetical protein
VSSKKPWPQFLFEGIGISEHVRLVISCILLPSLFSKLASIRRGWSQFMEQNTNLLLKPESLIKGIVQLGVRIRNFLCGKVSMFRNHKSQGSAKIRGSGSFNKPFCKQMPCERVSSWSVVQIAPQRQLRPRNSLESLTKSCSTASISVCSL